MDNNSGSLICAATCWGVGLLGGVLSAVLLMVLGGWGFMQGAFVGVVVFCHWRCSAELAVVQASACAGQRDHRTEDTGRTSCETGSQTCGSGTCGGSGSTRRRTSGEVIATTGSGRTGWP